MNKCEKAIKALQICSSARDCSSEDHFGCPYGDDSMIDCFDRLGQDLREVVNDICRQLDVGAPCYTCPHRLKENCQMYGCVLVTAAELLRLLSGTEEEK